MNTSKKITVSLVIFGGIALIFAVFVIYPLFNQIQKESGNLIFQKNRLGEFEVRAQNLKKFREAYDTYQPNLEKINELFIDSAEPVAFIEFLEKEAKTDRLSMNVAPLLLEEAKENTWLSMNFRLTLLGSFPNFLKFLEKLEQSPYLIKVLSLQIKRLIEKDLGFQEGEFIEGDISTILSIKVYAK